MNYYHVTITGIIPIEDGDPSPEHWPWTPKEEMLAQIDEHLLAIDVGFKILRHCPCRPIGNGCEICQE